MQLKNKIIEIWNLFSKIDSKEQMQWVLKDLLTPQEIETIYERIKLMQLLLQWKTQREVAKELWISITTVNRGARMLKYGSGQISDILQ